VRHRQRGRPFRSYRGGMREPGSARPAHQRRWRVRQDRRRYSAVYHLKSQIISVASNRSSLWAFVRRKQHSKPGTVRLELPEFPPDLKKGRPSWSHLNSSETSIWRGRNLAVLGLFFGLVRFTISNGKHAAMGYPLEQDDGTIRCPNQVPFRCPRTRRSTCPPRSPAIVTVPSAAVATALHWPAPATPKRRIAVVYGQPDDPMVSACVLGTLRSGHSRTGRPWPAQESSRCGPCLFQMPATRRTRKPVVAGDR